VCQMCGQDFRNCSLHIHFWNLWPARIPEPNERENLLLIHLKPFFFLQGQCLGDLGKKYLLRADYESRSDQLSEDWIRNLGIGIASQ
jgi:hypothetical protein